MAGGFVYTAVDQGQLATAEIYGKALSDIIMKDPKVVAITADLQNQQSSVTFSRFAPKELSTLVSLNRICSV